MRAARLNASVLDHDDLVGICHGGQAVRDDDQSLARHEPSNGALHAGLVFRIKVRANAQLKGLKKVSLKKGEKKRVEIHLPKEAFGLYDEEGKLCYQEGEAICYVGTNGPDHRSVELTGKKPAEITIKVPADC